MKALINRKVGVASERLKIACVCKRRNEKKPVDQSSAMVHKNELFSRSWFEDEEDLIKFIRPPEFLPLIKFDEKMFKIIITFCTEETPDFRPTLDYYGLHEKVNLIDLSMKNIRDDDIILVSYWLQSNMSLEDLNLCGNCIKNRGLRALAKALEVNVTLKVLNLYGNKFDDDGVFPLAAALKCNSTLVKLGISSNKVGDEGVRALAEVLKYNTTIIELKLSSNKVGNAGARHLADALTVNRTLESLDLRYNIGIEGEAAGIMASSILESKKIIYFSDIPVSVLRKNDKNMTKLLMRRKGFGCTEAWLLASLMMDNPTFTEVHLDENRICDDGAKILSLNLKKDNSLIELHLPENKISDEGAKWIAQGLQFNKSLRKLGLARNQITSKGARDLADALEKNNTLKVMMLTANRIGDCGSCAIAKSFKENQTLMHMSLHRNDIKDKGATAIADALKINKTMRELLLSDNKITNVGARDLIEALESNNVLERLDLRYNKIKLKNEPPPERIKTDFNQLTEKEHST